MPPIIGPRTPCASNGTGTSESISKNAATAIELAKLLLLRTAFSFSGCTISDWIFSGYISICTRCTRAALRIHGQILLHDQVHGAFDGDMRHASFFVDPAIAI